MKIVAAISALLLCQGALAQTFKCTDAAGKILYSGQPCADLGLKDVGEVRDRLQVTPAPPPSRTSTPSTKPAAVAQPEQPPADAAKPERRCFTTSVKGKTVTRCNDKPDE